MPGPHDAAGVKMLIHDHDDIPMVHALGQAISPGSRVFVGMKIIEVGHKNDRLLKMLPLFCKSKIFLHINDSH